MKKIGLIILITTFCFLQNISVQADPVDNDLGLWTGVVIKLPLTERNYADLWVNPRLNDNFGSFNQLLFGGIVSHKLTDNLNVGNGYEWLGFYNPDFFVENRIVQQIQHHGTWKGLNMTNRFRVEERFFSNDLDFLIRLRYLLEFKYPFGKEKQWAFVLSGEPFLHPYQVSGGGPPPGFSQSRVFLGFDRKLSEDVTFQAGYMLQHIGLKDADILNHNIVANFFLSLPQLF